MHRYVSCPLLVAVVLVTFAAARPSSRDWATWSRVKVRTGCSALGLCCQGKNNTCRANGQRMNQVDGNAYKVKAKDSNDESLATCFCDSACLELGDCCLDYNRACPAVDCIMDKEWSEWSGCDVRCGSGIKQRTRRVRQEPLNGGRPCPGNVVEKVVCEGTGCKVARSSQGHAELRETGKIIPATYGPWRKDKMYNPYEDIRRNLFEHYENQTNRPSYCMHFQLTKVRSACRKARPTKENNSEETWAEQLVQGQTICVECQPLAMRSDLGGRCRGHGVKGKETHWAAAVMANSAGCQGKWVMKSRQDGCQCESDSPLSFILI